MMKPPKPSPFFQPSQLSHARRGLSSPTRRALSWLAVLAITAIAIAGTIYFAIPRQTPSWKAARTDAPAAKVRAATSEEGTAELEIERNRRTHRLRVRKVGEKMVIEDVTPEDQKSTKRPWWQRR